MSFPTCWHTAPEAKERTTHLDRSLQLWGRTVHTVSLCVTTLYVWFDLSSSKNNPVFQRPCQTVTLMDCRSYVFYLFWYLFIRWVDFKKEFANHYSKSFYSFSFIHSHMSFIHTLTESHPFIGWRSRSQTHLLANSFIYYSHSSIHQLITHSLPFSHSFNWLIDSFSPSLYSFIIYIY